MSIQPGTMCGRYRVEERVGAGGMGEVWRVTDTASGASRALKTLHGAVPDDAQWKRFLSEGRIHSEIAHSGIAAFHEMFLYEDRPCIVMEFVPGETLHSRIALRGPIPPEQVRQILDQIAGAIGYLHSKGILHRDLKAANVKLTPEGQAKLLDFGIARYRLGSRLTQEGMVIGTPENLAPEVLRGQLASEASEIWAIGLLGYEMLTGQPAFAAAQPAAMHEAILSRTPTPPAAVVTGVPEDLSQVVMRCLEKEPGRRVASCDALRRLLRGAASTSVVAPGPFGRWIAMAAAVLLLAAVLLTWAGAGTGGGQQAVTVEVTNGPAEVWENGRYAGRTPFVRTGKMGETVNLVLRGDGFQEQPVQFEVSERKVYSYTMSRAR
ncbi:MAG: serine/threonine-protein kinase [Bryobacteraceae bacterium]